MGDPSVDSERRDLTSSGRMTSTGLRAKLMPQTSTVRLNAGR